ncbi:MAG TPA: HD domain-containing protein [Clostridia bacterium]|nr:HD domain-containing protein [Clostridia bacterium]
MIEDSLVSQELQQRIEELEKLLRVSMVLNSTLRLEEVLVMVLDQAMDTLQAEAGTLWLFTEDGAELLPLVARGPKGDALKGLRLKRGEGLAGQVADSMEPILVSDVTKDPRWASRFDAATGFITRSILCVPMVNKGKSIGCLQLVNKLGGQLFTERDLHLSMSLAGQSAVVIENSQLYSRLDLLLTSLIRTLSSALDARDPYTRGHSERVSKYSVAIARAMDLPEKELEDIEKIALLHDIGKIGVRDDVLLQQGPLNDEQWKMMKSHTTVGARILGAIEPQSLAREWMKGALYHQERYDGKGYPQGLAGKDIPLVARIIAVADTLDAMTTDRPYRKGRSFEEAYGEILRCAGTQFDPEVVAAFEKAAPVIQEMMGKKEN